MKRHILLAVAAVISCGMLSAQGTPSNKDRQRAEALVEQMTLEEKCGLIAGQTDGFHTAAIPRLGIPSVRMADGPQGVRNDTRSTYYPCGISLAAGWNRSTARGVGEGIGFDATARGVRIMLCPGVNIYRSALCGRNFEYYGEDPYLASETAVQYIQGMQESRVIATIKHFAANNQEYDRHWTGSLVDERTLNEIYFPTFRKAVQQANVGAVMTSYNPLNGSHAAENAWLIGQLRSWGHKGIVMSDWSSTYTTLGCLYSGLDLEMPKGYVLNYDAIKPLVENGVVPEWVIDEKCINIIQTFSAFGLLDNPMQDTSIPEDYDLSRERAYAAALEGPVLLQNNGVLPLKAGRKTEIVVLGPNASTVPYGGGSGRMDPIEGRNVTLEMGLKALDQKKFHTTLMDWKNLDEDVLRKASAVILSVGFNYNTETEGHDRTYALPQGQDELISRVADLNPNTAVVINSGGEVDIRPWKDKVNAILMSWYLGQEGGRALAAILSGAVSPSGKLPFTFWGSEELNPSFVNYKSEMPAVKKRSSNRDPYPNAEYKEGIFLGYRAVRDGVREPMYPFGYGLSYTSFQLGDISVSKSAEGATVCVTVRNTGKTAGSEVVQVYVAPVKPSTVRPAMELKGYAKVRLAAGESREILIKLPADSFSYYSVASHGWISPDKDFRICVGTSSDLSAMQEVNFCK